jgi:hypothetical protein
MAHGLSLLHAGPRCRRGPQRPTSRPSSTPPVRRLHEIVILGMKTWLRAETLRGLRQAEAWRRREVRLHFQLLERFRDEQRE